MTNSTYTPSVHLFVDMDGTLVTWKQAAYFEELLQENYFRDLPPYKEVVDAINWLNSTYPEIDVHVLSAYMPENPYSVNEKNEWLDTIFQRIYEDNITGKLSDERFMKMSKGYEDEQHTLQAEADKIQNELQQEEKKSVDVKRFLAIVKKYTDLTELTPEILREFVDKIIVHAPDKSSGRRLQEIEIIYNHIGEFDHSKVTLWKGNAV